MIRAIKIAVVLASIAISCGNACARINRSGPASGGGLESYEQADFGVGDAVTSSEFRKLNCGPGETRVGRDSFYTCNGRVFKKDMINGRLMYVVVPAMPY